MNAQQKINMAVRYSLDASTSLAQKVAVREQPQQRERTARERAVEFLTAGLQHELAGRLQEAEESFRRAVDADPSLPKTMLGGQLLGRGDYERGLELLEARSGMQYNSFPMPRWRGEDLRGRTIIVVFEQGLGDQIQFARFVPWLKERGAARVFCVGPPQLARLFARVAGTDGALLAARDPRYAQGHYHYQMRLPPGRIDYYVPILSLAYLFGVRVETIPSSSYLTAYTADIERWRPKLPQTSGLRVGLVWRGSPDTLRDAYRSLPSLATLAPLWRVPDVSFISLQVGAGEDEARRGVPGMPMLHLGSDVKDFADTAAILSQLDILVSVDTSTAHLAGALGKPVWLLLDHAPDWRWHHEIARQRWYPTVRVFPQHTQGDWSRPVNEVATALEAFRQQRSMGSYETR